MADPDDRADADDAWLTVAEIAEELRVNPATVRLWVSKGTLPATRAGLRKLLIRRSDLDAMLRARNKEPPGVAEEPRRAPSGAPRLEGPPQSFSRFSPTDPGKRDEEDEILSVLKDIQRADELWAHARDASENAPPDPGFPDRLNDLLLAAETQSRSLGRAGAISRMSWDPITNSREMSISHELRPGANRPGPAQLWAEFDRCVQRLGISMEGRDMSVIAARWHDVALALRPIIDALDESSYGAHEQRQ